MRPAIAAALITAALIAGCTASPTDGERSPVPGAVTAVRMIAAGGGSSCLLSEDDIHCWGKGDEGELGDGFGSDRLFPRPVLFSLQEGGFRTLAMGHAHSCAVFATGALYCWGRGYSGALGRASRANAHRPVLVGALNGKERAVRTVAAGAYHTCALTEDDALYCWGYSGDGQIGTATFDEPNSHPTTTTPTAVTGHLTDAPITSLSAGGYHTCATYADGTAACWGNSQNGQLGNNCTFGSEQADHSCQNNQNTPVAIPYFDTSSAHRWTQTVAAGGYHSCIISKSDNLFCFGRGFHGQLGINSARSYSVPNHVGNIPASTRSVALGDIHSCALLSTGAVYCFGSNDYGQLGNSSTHLSLIPTAVDFSRYSNPAMVGIAAGHTHTCSWDRNGTYYCWGNNSRGQLGIGIQGGIRSTPTVGLQK